MHNHRQLNIMIVIVILLVGSVHFVLADAAPPQRPPAGSIETGGFETNVQMVSEEVLMHVGMSLDPESGDYVEDNSFMAHVEATFWMQNQGDETESFDVWFPTGVEDGYFDISVVENFAAWVDDVPAVLGKEETEGQWGDPVPWATWPVTFPPGETVVLTVSYDLWPTGYWPYGEFIYILETGAGWWGSIGEGTVTVRLPYQVNEYNTPWRPTSNAIDSFEIDGTDLIWQFTDLEPTKADNIRINLLAPSVWTGILAAEEGLAENPESADAYLNLALEQVDALQFKYGLICCQTLADAATINFQQALALEPESVDAQIAYLDLLLSLWFPYVMESYSEDIPILIQELLIEVPDDERFLDLLSRALGSFRWGTDSNTENREEIQAIFDEVIAAVEEAIAAHPENTRLFEIYDAVMPKG